MADDRARIAIVDDDEWVVRSLTHTIETLGYRVSAVAHTFDQALALVDQPDACDVVFVDLGLGGAPAGIDVARRAVRNGLAVVVMTGGASVPTDLDGAALLIKPFSSDAVRTLLHRLARRGPVAVT